MTSQQLIQMIATKSYPDSVNLFYREWIDTLYLQGKAQQAMRTLQKIIDNPIIQKQKSLL